MFSDPDGCAWKRCRRETDTVFAGVDLCAEHLELALERVQTGSRWAAVVQWLTGRISPDRREELAEVRA